MLIELSSALDGRPIDPVSGSGLGKHIDGCLVLFGGNVGVVGVPTSGHGGVDAPTVGGCVYEHQGGVDGTALGSVAGLGISQIVSAQSSIDGYRLQLVLTSCNASIGVDIVEGPDTVEVTATDLDAPTLLPGGGDCQDDRIVELNQPLDQRKVIDGNTDTVVDVQPSSAASHSEWPYDRERFTESQYEDALAATVLCLEAGDATIDAYVYQALDWKTYRWEKKPNEQNGGKEPAELVDELPTSDVIEPCELEHLEPLR